MSDYIPFISEIRRGNDRKHRALSDAQINQAKTIFNDFKDKSFRPAYRADVDETREDLDKEVIIKWLGFDKSIYDAVRGLARKWCAEPSVHGGKQSKIISMRGKQRQSL